MKVVSGGRAEGFGVCGTSPVLVCNWATIWSDGLLPSNHNTQRSSAVMCGRTAAAAGWPRELALYRACQFGSPETFALRSQNILELLVANSLAS